MEEFQKLKHQTFKDWFNGYDATKYSQENVAAEAFEVGSEFGREVARQYLQLAMDTLIKDYDTIPFYNVFLKHRARGAVAAIRTILEFDKKL